MRYTFILLLFASTISFAQKGFNRKNKVLGDPSQVGKNTPQGQFVEIQGEKNDRNVRQSSIKGVSTKLISKLKVVRDSETGGILMIENFSKVTPGARVSMQAMSTNFLGDVKKVLQIDDPAQELEMIKMETDEIGMTHIQIQQKYKSVLVYGGEIWLHSKGDKIDVLNGRNFPTPKLSSTSPAISEAKAIEMAMIDVAKKSIIQPAGSVQNLLVKQKNTAELVIYHMDGNPANEHLTYLLSIRPNLLERWTYFVDANTGEVLKKFNNTCALDGPFTATSKDLNNITRTINIQQVGGSYYLVDTQRAMYNKVTSKLPDDPIGVIWTIDAKNSTSDNMQYSQIGSTNGINWTTTAVSAHHNAGICYDFFRTKFNRNSLDGKGGSVVSVINIADEDGKGMDNAYWNGEFMGYGNGRDAFKPLAGALDVGGHEMTHGVVEASARLEYQNQSGALNESFADIFGAMIDRDDWTLGEDIVKGGVYPSGALRSLSNPNQGGKSDPGYQPKTMSQYVFLKNTEDEDNGGVHVNSGIPNYAFFLFASNTNVGKDKAEQVYYRALTKYLTRTSKFVDARLSVVKSAADLYGENSAVVNAAKAAFDAVGIADPSGNSNPTTPAPTPVPPQQNIPVNNGGDFILVFEPSTGKLYTGKANDTQYKVVSSSGCLSKPSVTDDGLFAYFVGKDQNIRRLSLTGSFTETKLTSDAVWGNVTVSKDGKRLAALTKVGDKFMYVFNLEDNKSIKFKLYNPTYSSGVSTGEVMYADSFEWDYSGEVVIYDAFNNLKSVSGTIEFWDVGLINAWDLTKKTFGDGKIEKLFSDLEAGESIGNPSFSKNTQNIIAFDYYTEDEPDTYYQIGVDIENNDLDIVYENTEIGYPGYSRLDDKMLFNGPKDVVKIINLDKNKISPSGTVKDLFTDAKWAVWYAQGVRALPTKTDQTMSFGAISDKNPGDNFNISATASSGLAIQFAIEAGDVTISGNRVTVGTTAGKARIKAFQVGSTQFNSISVTQSFCVIPTAPKVVSSGGNLTVSGGKNYQWYLNGNLINGFTLSSFTPGDGGMYSAKNVTDDGCASAFSNAVEVKAPVLGTELDESIKVSIYPNPAADELRIELPAGITFKEANFYSGNGSEVLKYDRISSNNSLNISQLVKGMYSVKIETSWGYVVRKIIRE